VNGAPVAGVAAAWTRMSIPPSWEVTDATIALTEESSPVSAIAQITRRPLSLATSWAACRSASSPRATSATSTPSAASDRAAANPIPRLPPVTTARRPVSSRSTARSLVAVDRGCHSAAASLV
jgi:hypothetical protein